MKWNYRLVRFSEGGEILVCLREVFYEEDGRIMGHTAPFLCGDTEEEAREVMQIVAKDLTQPILDMEKVELPKP